MAKPYSDQGVYSPLYPRQENADYKQMAEEIATALVCTHNYPPDVAIETVKRQEKQVQAAFEDWRMGAKKAERLQPIARAMAYTLAIRGPRME